MTRAQTTGLPRIGARRDLKAALDAFWRGESDLATLEAAGRDLRARRWRTQRAAGVEAILSNDVSFCDPVLDMTATLGAVPARFGAGAEDEIGLETRFAMARGAAGAPAMRQAVLFGGESSVTAPELAPGQTFRLAARDAENAFAEAKAIGAHTRPVLIGPVTWLSLARADAEGFDPLTLLPAVLPVYAELLARLSRAGADWVRIEEPVLACYLNQMQRAAFWTAYDELAKAAPQLMVGVGPAAPAESLDVAVKLPVAGLHLDLCRAPEMLAPVLAGLRSGAALSLEVFDGRGFGQAAMQTAFAPVARAARTLGADRVEVAPSAALLDIDTAPRGLEAVAALTRALREGRGAVMPERAGDSLSDADAA